MHSKYVIWKSDTNIPNACVLGEFKRVDKSFQLRKGVPRAATFQEDASFTMHEDHPYDTLLTDSLNNIFMMIVASRRLKEFLEARALKQVEYLPVTILDHKGRPASRDYFIIHPVNPVDCLNIDECNARWGHIDKNSIKFVKRLVLDVSKIDPERELFRPKYYHKVILVRQDLAEAIDREGFTGIWWDSVHRIE